MREAQTIGNEIARSNPSVYRTAVGIIQSIALYFFLEDAALPQLILNEPVSGWEVGSWTFVLEAFQALCCFLIIGLTWHVYSQNVIVFFKTFNLVDALYPFVFLLTEYYLMKFANAGQAVSWFTAMGFFFLAALVGHAQFYLTAYYHKAGDVRGRVNAPIFAALKMYPLLICGYLACGMVAAFAIVRWLPETPAAQTGAAVSVLIFIVIYACLHQVYSWKRVVGLPHPGTA